MVLTTKEKIAYGLGDTASNLVFQTVMLFIAYFYTDIFGISAASAGLMFLAIRILDAITDPLMGYMSDRTQTRWGSYRPYLLWFALPFAMICMATFNTPDLSPSGKLIYAYVTYGLLMVIYTAINIPYSALGAALTPDHTERVSLQSYRFVFGMLGGLIVATSTLKLAECFGGENTAVGYQLAMSFFGIVGFILFLLCFAGTKERVPTSNNTNTNVFQQLKILSHNDQWRVLSFAAFMLLIGLVLKNSLAIYYVQYVLGDKDFITTFITVGMIGNIIGCFLARYIPMFMCKVKAYIGLQVASSFICSGSYFISTQDTLAPMIAYFVWSLVIQAATPLLWSKMSDTVDYGESLNGERHSGMIHASIVFFIKLGLAVGGALTGWLLALYGYEANSIQTEETKQGIILSFTLLPALFSVAVALIMRKYKLDDQRMHEIKQTLKQQRR